MTQKNPDDFKKWVHTFLDEIGIDKYEGYDCRIGMRLKMLCEQCDYSDETIAAARKKANDAIGVETKDD
jgi:hypothetical protein